MAKKNTSGSNVTRIKATADEKKANNTPAAEPAKQPTAKKPTSKSARRNPLVAMRDYFVGAWYEIRQVRWPNRRATWSLTLAVIVFTAFFVLVILVLDAGFKYLFELVLA